MTQLEREMAKQLRAAGWKRLSSGMVYQSPNTGGCWRLKKAWQIMQARKAAMEFAATAVRITDSSPKGSDRGDESGE